jgi:hypothetical protein
MSIAYNAVSLAGYLESPGYDPQSSFGELAPVVNHVARYGLLAYLPDIRIITSFNP